MLLVELLASDLFLGVRWFMHVGASGGHLSEHPREETRDACRINAAIGLVACDDQ